MNSGTAKRKTGRRVVVCVFVWGAIDHVAVVRAEEASRMQADLGGFMRSVYVDGIGTSGSRMSESEDMGQVQRAALMAKRIKQGQPAWDW